MQAFDGHKGKAFHYIEDDDDSREAAMEEVTAYGAQVGAWPAGGSQQMGTLASPSKPPAPKKPKKDGDGGSSSQAIEISP